MRVKTESEEISQSESVLQNGKPPKRRNRGDIAAMLRREWRNNWPGWMFILPLIIGIAVFTVYPMLQSFIYSFYNYDGSRVFEFAGIANFRYMFGLDFDEVLKVFGNTFLYAIISVPLNLCLSYLLAVLVNQKIKGVTAFRVMYYLPVVIPGVVSGVIWSQIMDPSSQGIFNTILGVFGIPASGFFATASTAMLSAIVMNLWGLGGGMILWLAALKNIPAGLYEAAKIDGASVFRRFISITIPMSTPMIFYNLVTGLIGAMQTNNTMVFASNGGRGPQDSLYFIVVKIYNEAFIGKDFGYASALAWILFFIIAVLTALTFMTNKWVYTGDE